MYRIVAVSEKEPSYQDKEFLAEGLHTITRKYFEDVGHGTPRPYVSYGAWNALYYSFEYSNSQMNMMTTMQLIGTDDYTQSNNLKAFRSEVRQYLKSLGFTKVKFNISTRKQTGTQYYGSNPEYTIKTLDSVQFDTQDHSCPILSATKLTAKGFFKFFDKSVDKQVQRDAAKILYEWYSEEGEEFMPDLDDILDMCDAATDIWERNLVLEALGYEWVEDDEEDW